MAQMSGMDKYKFRRALEQIEEAEGRGTELVSVYIPPERPIFEVTNYLRAELSQSSNIKSASTRKHVTQAIESAMQRLRAYKMPPPNGLVIFTGHRQVGADQTQMVTFVLEPPEPVTSFLYRCDSKFYTAPLHEMLAEKDVYGLVVIDWSEATIGVLRGKRIEVIKNLQSQVPSKHRMGGQSARRFERGHDIAVHEWYKKIGELMTEAFLNRPELKGIIIGGPGYSKEEFATGEFMHHELKKKVLPTFLDTGYTDEYGLRELVEKSREILSGLDLMREKTLVQRLMEEIRKADGGLAAYGEDQVRNALRLGAVDTLLISEGLRKVRLKLRCGNGDWEGEKTVDDAGELPTCPKDGGPLTVLENRELIEDLTSMAAQMGSNVELISKDSEEGQLLLRAFGGIAAILRFRVS
jgi:peptide chain release factor subunit 1